MIPQQALGELVTFQSKKGLSLDGILYAAKGARKTVIHVHGSLGNFYQNRFIRVMGRRYVDAGVNLLSFNLSGHDGIAEGYRGESFEYVGGSVVEFEECVHDIQGAITFASAFSKKIVLQGHSLGCDRILHYLLSMAGRHDFILLSPCDSYRLQCDQIRPETVEQQISRLKADTNIAAGDFVPKREYGISEKGDEYYIPITKRALLSILEGPVCRLIRLESPADFFIEGRCFIYIGGTDPLQAATSNEMFSYFEERVSDVRRLFVSVGDHDLSSCEEHVAQEVVAWLAENSQEL